MTCARGLTLVTMALAACGTGGGPAATGTTTSGRAQDATPKAASQQPQLAIDPSSSLYRPAIPAALPAGPRTFALRACAAKTGQVIEAHVWQGAEPEANREVEKKVLAWRYQPYTVDGQLTFFCVPLRLTIEGEAAGISVTARAAEPLPRMVAPAEGMARLRVDPRQDAYRPLRPAQYAATKFAIVKVCASPGGEVTDVKVLNEASGFADEIAAKVGAWRFDTMMLDGRAVPFCFVTRLDFGS